MLSVKVAAGVALLGAAVVLAALVAAPSTNSVAMGSALMGTWTKQHGIGIDKEPYSAPMNLWLYWGSMTNRRFTASGEHVRHVFKMGNIAGGEWRDPKFLRSLEGGLFNKLSSLCCTALLFPPLEWDFLVVNPQKIVGQNIRAYVANGNTMIFTGGIISLEFINRYFSYQLEPADGNLDPGPFLRLPKFQGFTQEQHKIMTEGTPSTEPAPKTLPQVGIEVTSVKKESLPSGASVIYTSPYNAAVFAIKFCEAENPMNDPAAPLPPVKVLPRDCPITAAQGRPCSCGFICYLGYDWRDAYPSRWDYALKSMVDVCSMVPPENSNPTLLRQLAVDAEPSAAEEEKEEEEKEEEVEEKIKEKNGEEGKEEEEKAEEAEDKESKEEAVKEEEEEKEEAAKEEEKEAIKEEVAKEVKEELEVKEEGKPGPAAPAPPPAAAAAAKCVDCEGLEGFGEEEGCGPLCKLERLVGQLKDDSN
eukprot:Tamp_12432.p1 GENE.Tamp_12432~~Tamp_12432.p1  ORF type:complete len:491 (-),score=200.19 Tamp_12432:340-1761(-)